MFTVEHPVFINYSDKQKIINKKELPKIDQWVTWVGSYGS